MTSKSAWILLVITVLLLFLASLLTGSVSIPVQGLFDALRGEPGMYSDIVWTFRLPRAVTCLFAGSALAVSGLMMQTLFRNPLAGPDVLGLTSGSNLLVALVILSGQGMAMAFSNPWTIAIAAAAGSALVFIAVLAISRFVAGNTSLLIVGLMLAATTSSIVSLLLYLSRAEDLQAFMIWGLGSVGGTSWDEILVLALVSLSGCGLAIYLMKPLNAMLLGDNYATSLGINVRRSRFLVITATSLLTGGVTAFCGPIAFVGLAVPHLIRLILPTSNHKALIPGVMIGGALLVLFCDIIAQAPGSVLMLPLNAVTSLIGAPVVIWLVIRSKKISS